MTPIHLSKMWESSLSAKVLLPFYLVIHESTLSGGTLSTSPSNFHLVISGGIINSSSSFRVVAISPTRPLNENLKTIHPPCHFYSLQFSTKECSCPQTNDMGDWSYCVSTQKTFVLKIFCVGIESTHQHGQVR